MRIELLLATLVCTPALASPQGDLKVEELRPPVLEIGISSPGRATGLNQGLADLGLRIETLDGAFVGRWKALAPPVDATVLVDSLTGEESGWIWSDFVPDADGLTGEEAGWLWDKGEELILVDALTGEEAGWLWLGDSPEAVLY